MKIKEIMIREVKNLSPEMSVKEALGLILGMKISGLPVVDNNGSLLGMFTEKEVLAYILPSYIDKVGKFVYEENPKATKRKFAELGGLKVSQLMRKGIVTVHEDNALCEVARTMLTQRARRIPVLNKEGKIVGIVAREDILKAFSREAEQAGL